MQQRIYLPRNLSNFRIKLTYLFVLVDVIGISFFASAGNLTCTHINGFNFYDNVFVKKVLIVKNIYLDIECYAHFYNARRNSAMKFMIIQAQA